MIFKAIVIGGGPAGMSCACAIDKQFPVLIIERENRLGGILKQCVHDGFGVVAFGEKLSGPEYAERYIDKTLASENITVKLLNFVVKIVKKGNLFEVTTTSSEGIITYTTENLILANGCRERTPRQVNIHGTRPYGLLTAGTAQNYVNLMGVMPTKKCVILGSGDIGLIMARRLTLEGACVLGVYEAKSTPSGLSRNIQQCLIDFDIPLHLSTTVTRVFGEKRVEKVEVMKVDENMTPIKGTEEIIACDSCIVSVGLIPENELAESLNIDIDPLTRGPYVDQNMMTNLANVYSVGNALHVHDLVDFVSEVSAVAGKNIKNNSYKRQLVSVSQEGMGYIVPQKLDCNNLEEKTIFYFRCRKEMSKAILKVFINNEEVLSKKYNNLKPPEAERLSISLKLSNNDKVLFRLKEVK